MLKKLHENFKVIFGEESRESFFASARKFRLSEETSIDENLAYGTYAAAKERNDGMISVSFGEGKYTLPLDNLDSEVDLEFIASVVEAYKSCGYSIKKGLDIIYHMDVPTEEGYCYMIAEEEGGHSFRKIVGMEILSIHRNESMVVVKTITGRANGVALFIDQLKNPHIIATLAGENALLVIPDRTGHLNKIERELSKIAAGG